MAESESEDIYDDFIDLLLEETNLEQQNCKKETIEEIIISMVAKEPVIFDKSYTSKSNILVERMSKYNLISQAIYNVFQVYLSGKCYFLFRNVYFQIYIN